GWWQRQQAQPYPQPAAAISPENAAQVVQLARWTQDRVLGDGFVLSWSPSGRWLMIRSTKGLRLYEGDNFSDYQTVETGEHPVLSPNEKLVASAINPTGTIRLSELETGRTVYEWKPHSTTISSLWFAGQVLFSRDEDRNLVATDITTNPPTELLRISDVSGGIYTSSDSSRLIEINTDFSKQPPTQQIRVCRVNEGQCEMGAGDDVGGLIVDISENFTEQEGAILFWKGDNRLVATNMQGEEISTLGVYTETDRLPAAFLSPNGTYAIADDKIWRVSDGQVIATAEMLAQKMGEDEPLPLYWARFSPDERYLLIIRHPLNNLNNNVLVDLNNLGITQLANPKPLRMGTIVSRSNFRPDSQRMALVGEIGMGGKIQVYKLPDAHLMGEIDADTATAVLGLAFTPEGQLAVMYPGMFQVRSLEGEILYTIQHTAGLDFVFARDGIYWQNENKYRFTPYDTARSARNLEFTLPPTSGSITRVYSNLNTARGSFFAVSNDGNLWAFEQMVDHESSVLLYRAEELEPDHHITLSEQLDSGLLFAPDASLLAAGLEKGVLLLSTSDLSVVRQKTLEEEITGLTFSPDSRILAITTDAGKVYLWDVGADTLVSFETGANHSSVPSFSPDGSLLSLVVPDGVQIWDVSNRQVLRTLDATDVVSIAFSPDQRLLAAGTKYDT
ncbi:MAG: WD40 repeat domain-containing protein, partial [Anaerolineae bacterium]